MTRIISNTLALYLAGILVTGFVIYGGLREYLIAGTMLGILNMVVKPILKLVTFPLILITLGLFTLVINAFLLWAVASLFSFVVITSLWALILATIVVSVVNLFVSHHL